tara:strand:+ start:784 stop:1461 length:678 start_codon:yes stop_codon:yes gene_type:complete
MNFKELQDEVSDLLNFNSSQTDQDFTTSQIKKSINRAYQRETTKARQEGSSSHFKARTDITWPSGSLTFSLPERLKGAQIIKITDITENQSGSGFYIVVYDGGDPGPPDYGTPAWDNQTILGSVFWRDRNTLQWGEDGPSEDKTLRVDFLSRAETLINDDDVPELVPIEHHELLFYSAAIDLRTRADEAAPVEWLRQQMELRIDFHKDVSRGKPYTNVPTIGSHY